MNISGLLRQIYTLEGTRITEVYGKNRMGVHNQGHYLSVSSPLAIAKEGTLTLSVVVSPNGAVTGIIDAGALVFLNDTPLQLASVPYVRINGDTGHMLTSKAMTSFNNPDDFSLPYNYYFPMVPQKHVSVSLATPLAEMCYHINKTDVTRRIISPLLSQNDQFLPAAVEEYELTNCSRRVQQITVVVPMPSLVNSSRKVSRPREQDYTFIGAAAVEGQVHTRFAEQGITGVSMGSCRCSDRMVIAVPQRDDITVSLQEAFRLRNYNQDLLLADDGSFHHENSIQAGNDYGAAVNFTVTLPAGATVTVPVVKLFDFPVQRYPDSVDIVRRYTVDFPEEASRDRVMALAVLRNYAGWRDRTLSVQQNIVIAVKKTAAYKDDDEGALRVSRLLFNELSYLFSNASVLNKNGHARFLECFDYPFNNSADVDFYSKLLLAVFPEMELDLCQKFVDSINVCDEKYRFYHSFISDPLMQQQYLTDLKKSGKPAGEDIHIYAATKADGSVYHDLGSLTFGNPLRDVSEYTWFNTSYWIDLFPKLALRVLRDARYTGRTDLITRNWKTLVKGFEYLMSLDYDGDGIPEGRAGEVRNTYDNIPFAGIDVYDVNIFVACLLAMSRMAAIVGDTAGSERFGLMLVAAQSGYERLWLETTTADGRDMSYYITCTGNSDGNGRCTDVFTDQLVGLWQWIAMGERPFLPDDRVVKLLRTIYINNRTPMGWATARKQDGSPVDSDQGKDVWIASNYVLAQLLDYYDLVAESKEVYQVMDRIVFEHGNSLNTAESVRPDFEKQEGEKKPEPHYIVASYPRPGAVYDILFLNAIKKEWERTPDAECIADDRLQQIALSIFNG